MTITEQTAARYRTRALQLIAQAKAAFGDETLSARQMAQWLRDQQPRYRKTTWRQYRAALVYEWCQPYPNGNGDEIGRCDETDRAEAIAILRQTPPPSGRPAQRQTSAQKLKKIPERDLLRLLDHSLTHPSRHSHAALCWLLAGLWTGLRPAEWEHAQLLTPTRLKVINAKATQGRAHGVYRSLDLSALTAQECEIIRLHLANVQQAKDKPGDRHATGFERFYSHCRAWLYEATRTLWPRRKRQITLYSARHQFAANAKFDGLPLEQIAALMGHASTDTATHHYGRRTAGQGGVRVQADQADVERVRELNRRRLENKKRSDLGM